MISDPLAKSDSQPVEFQVGRLIESEIDPHTAVEGEVFLVESGRLVGECRQSFEAMGDYVPQLLKLQCFYG